MLAIVRGNIIVPCGGYIEAGVDPALAMRPLPGRARGAMLNMFYRRHG